MSLLKKFLEISGFEDLRERQFYDFLENSNSEAVNAYTKRIEKGDVLNGILHFKGNLIIDGHLEGNVTFDENSIIIIEENGFIKTDNLVCNQLIVFGKIECLDLTSNFLQVEKNSSLDVKQLLKLKYLNVKNGGVLNAKVNINENNSSIGSFDVASIKKYYEKDVSDFGIENKKHENMENKKCNVITQNNHHNNEVAQKSETISKNIKNSSASVAKERLLNVKN